MRYYDPGHRRLIHYARAASSGFWDVHWQSDDFAQAIRSLHRFVIRWTQRYLPRGSKVLDGGCGRGQNVYSLQQAGYEACGVDFARQTVALVNQHAPELKVMEGDVRDLDFPDGFFDGYWSLGVIEHFAEGYGPIMAEMARVLRRGGYLFLTFPHMSFLRRQKAKLGMYPDLRRGAPEALPKDFYQFVLDAGKVVDDFGKAGFQNVLRTGYAGLKGFKDESGPFKSLLQRLYDSEAVTARVTRVITEPLLRTWCGHSALLIFCKI
jgi:SAM-dependent methyltransferase